MRVLVTGATGYVGSAIAAAFLNGANAVTGTGRSAEKAKALVARGMTFAEAKLDDAETLRRLASEHQVIVHAAIASGADRDALDAAATEALLEGAKVRARVFVYTSGLWVLGATPQGADETAPLNPTTRSAWRKALEPRVLGATSDRLRTHVIRPGRVYGGKGGAFAEWIEAGLAGKPVRVIGDGSQRWPTIHRDDLAELYRRVVEAGSPAGLYHGTDDTAHTAKKLADAIAAAAGAPNVAQWPLDHARKELGADYAEALAMDQVVKSVASRKLGWLPRHADPLLEADHLYDEYVAAPPEA